MRKIFTKKVLTNPSCGANIFASNAMTAKKYGFAKAFRESADGVSRQRAKIGIHLGSSAPKYARAYA